MELEAGCVSQLGDWSRVEELTRRGGGERGVGVGGELLVVI